MKIKITLSIVLLGIAFNTNAQSTNDQFAGYSPSVVRQLYQVTSKVELSNSKIAELATLFKDQDEKIAEAIRTNQPSGTAAILAETQSQIKKILSPEELQTFYKKTAEKSTFKYIPDEKGLRIAKAKVLFKNKLEELNKIKPLTSLEKQELEKAFIDQVSNSDKFLTTDFKSVLKKTMKDPVYYATMYTNLYSDTIKRSSAKLQKFSPKTQELIAKRDKELQVIQRSIGDAKRADSLKKAVRALNSKKIDSTKLANEDIHVKSALNLALAYQKELKLTKKQIDSLNSKIINLKKLRIKVHKQNPKLKYDSRTYAENLLKIILTERQRSLMDMLRYRKAATDYATKTWAELENRKLTSGLDKKIVFNELVNYRLKTLAEKSNKKIDSSAVSAEKPIIARPDVLRKLQASRKNPNADAALNSSFKW